MIDVWGPSKQPPDVQSVQLKHAQLGLIGISEHFLACPLNEVSKPLSDRTRVTLSDLTGAPESDPSACPFLPELNLPFPRHPIGNPSPPPLPKQWDAA